VPLSALRNNTISFQEQPKPSPLPSPKPQVIVPQNARPTTYRDLSDEPAGATWWNMRSTGRNSRRWSATEMATEMATQGSTEQLAPEPLPSDTVPPVEAGFRRWVIKRPT
jgi:hypothetical protein